MADEGVGKIFFPRKKKKPPDDCTVNVETADEKATSDSTVRPLPTRRRCTNDQGVLAPHACDQEVRRPLATAENATDAAATTTAAAIKTMAANAPTNPQTLPGIRGIAPSVYPRPGKCCRRDVDGRSGDEWGLRWELAVGGVPWRRPKAPLLSLPPTTAAAIKTMAANAPTDPQVLLGIRGIAPTVTASSVYLRPGSSGEERGPAGSWLWEAVGG
jgi:hypothetical protein